MEILITETSVEHLIAKAGPLFDKHFIEAEQGEPALMLDVYLELDRSGQLRCVAAYDEDDEVVGYAVAIVSVCPHSSAIMAECTALYVVPEYRHTNISEEIIRELEKVAKEALAEELRFGMKPHLTYHGLMRAAGYELVEYKYGKRMA